MSTTVSSPAAPASLPELVDAVRSLPKLIAVGSGTKPRPSEVGEAYARLSLANLSGITEYEPSEFTFTALAGTKVREIVAALAERGQYLPFDPLLVHAGATIGGTVASGLNGPGRVRYGGLRDFIIGVRMVDGEGRLLRLGGKVVKNAAGFDIPKFLVGSVGRYGVIGDVSFKVFPKPQATRTLRLDAKDGAAKAALINALASGRWECDALDAAVGEPAVFARLAGPAEALDALSADVLARWTGAAMTPGDASYLWQSVNELRWAHTGGTLVKCAFTPAAIPTFVDAVRGVAEACGWISAAGNVGWLSLPPGAVLPELPWPGMTIRGGAPLWVGPRARFAVGAALKQALDPLGRFPDIDAGGAA